MSDSQADNRKVWESSSSLKPVAADAQCSGVTMALPTKLSWRTSLGASERPNVGVQQAEEPRLERPAGALQQLECESEGSSFAPERNDKSLALVWR